jgi:hypothetical protein
MLSNPGGLIMFIIIELRKLSDWRIIHSSASRVAPNILACRQTGPPECLAKHFLTVQAHTLLKDDLVRVAADFDLETTGTKPALLRRIATELGGGDDDYVNLVMKCDKEPPKPKDINALLCDDPTCEEVFNDLAEDDKFEFGDMKKQLAKKRLKSRMADYKQQKSIEKQIAQGLSGERGALAKKRRVGLRRWVYMPDVDAPPPASPLRPPAPVSPAGSGGGDITPPRPLGGNVTPPLPLGEFYIHSTS